MSSPLPPPDRRLTPERRRHIVPDPPDLPTPTSDADLEQIRAELYDEHTPTDPPAAPHTRRVVVAIIAAFTLIGVIGYVAVDAVTEQSNNRDTLARNQAILARNQAELARASEQLAQTQAALCRFAAGSADTKERMIIRIAERAGLEITDQVVVDVQADIADERAKLDGYCPPPATTNP